jgi:hypothetical protein
MGIFKIDMPLLRVGKRCRGGSKGHITPLRMCKVGTGNGGTQRQPKSEHTSGTKSILRPVAQK